MWGYLKSNISNIPQLSNRLEITKDVKKINNTHYGLNMEISNSKIINRVCKFYVQLQNCIGTESGPAGNSKKWN